MACYQASVQRYRQAARWRNSLPHQHQLGGSGGSKSGPRDTTAELKTADRPPATLLEIEKERFGLTERELEATVQPTTLRGRMQNLRGSVIFNAKTSQQKAKSNLASSWHVAGLSVSCSRSITLNSSLKLPLPSDIQQQITDLETQIAVEEAITDEMKEQAILAARIAEIQAWTGIGS